MIFVVGFPLRSLRHNAILVVVDKLSKISHFIPFRDTYDVTYVARVFIYEIVRLHGVPKKIIFDRDPNFTSRFWTWHAVSIMDPAKLKLSLSSQDRWADREGESGDGGHA